MNGDELLLDDPCIEDVFWSHLGNYPFKREFDHSSMPNFEFDSDPLSMDTVSHTIHPLQSRLPPRPLMPGAASPAANYDMYPTQMINSGALIRSSLSYSNAPDTPPDTPPVSSPGSAFQNQYQHLVQHQYPQQVPKDPLTGSFDSMTWMNESVKFPHTESVKFPHAEPLDLRGTYSGESWNVMQQHTSVITSAASKRFLQNSIPQRKNTHDQKVSVGSKIGKPKTSPTKHLPLVGEPKIEDVLLTELSVKDLNTKLKNFPKEKQGQLKLKRRTLKNRIYARNCRQKREQQKEELLKENEKLRAEISSLESQVRQLMHEKDILERRINGLLSEINCMSEVGQSNEYV